MPDELGIGTLDTMTSNPGSSPQQGSGSFLAQHGRRFTGFRCSLTDEDGQRKAKGVLPDETGRMCTSQMPLPALDRTPQAYAIRAAVTTFMLLHFGLVRTYLQYLDLVPGRILGYRVFAHDTGRGDFDNEFAASQALAVLGLLLVGMATSLVAVYFLAVNRHNLLDRNFTHAVGSLYSGYRVAVPGACLGGFWYWEVLIVSMRKILLLTVVVTVDERYSQLSLLLLVLSVSLVLHLSAMPLEAPLLNRLEAASLLSLTFVALLGLANETEGSSSSSANDETKAFGVRAAGIVVNVAFTCFAVVAAVKSATVASGAWLSRIMTSRCDALCAKRSIKQRPTRVSSVAATNDLL